jgi:biotin carboxyl carrier protein
MPGTVIDVLVRQKQTVKAGDPLMILEAMKMEHQISANIDGKVRNVYFQKGDQVQDGTLLLEIEAIQAKSKKIE